jgi:Fe-S cluster assembly scaffold protein SufB
LDKQVLPSSGSINITVKENTKIKLYEPEQGANLEVIVHIHKGAQVEYITGSMQNINLHITLDEYALFTQKFSSNKVENRKQVFILSGQKSQVDVSGSYLLDAGIGMFDVVQLHSAPRATSTVEVKTVLDGKAQFEYRGNIKIEQSAPGSSAHQENKNLVVSSQAKALSIPSLEALNDDVQCGHGSAVSYINQEHLFYLSSRGIEYAIAKKIIIKGFLEDF